MLHLVESITLCKVHLYHQSPLNFEGKSQIGCLRKMLLVSGISRETLYEKNRILLYEHWRWLIYLNWKLQNLFHTSLNVCSGLNNVTFLHFRTSS